MKKIHNWLTLVLLLLAAPASAQSLFTVDSAYITPGNTPILQPNQPAYLVIEYTANFSPCANITYQVNIGGMGGIYTCTASGVIDTQGTTYPLPCNGVDSIYIGNYPTNTYIQIPPVGYTLLNDPNTVIANTMAFTLYVQGYGTIDAVQYIDLDQDCQYDSTDLNITSMYVSLFDQSNQLIGIETANWLGTTVFSVDSPMTYTVQGISNGVLDASGCPPQTATIVSFGDVEETEIPFWFTDTCYLPHIDLSYATPVLCAPNPVTVTYTNYGSTTIPNAVVTLAYDTSFQFLSTTQPYTLNGNVLTFAVGNVPPFTSQQFVVLFQNSCYVDQLLQTKCFDVSMSPASDCFGLNPNWNGASIDVEGFCENDSVKFRIHNVGTAPSSTLQYGVYEDWVMIDQQNFQVNPGSYVEVMVPSDGSTYWLQAQQEFFHPGTSLPRAFVEACGPQPHNLGFINTVQPDDLDDTTETECLVLIGPYDPNDKQVSPQGSFAPHYISAQQQLQYTVRFQNTGSAPAQHVYITDSIDIQYLDVLSVDIVSSSHPMTWTYNNGVIVFRFENINLPDSTTDNAGSMGFVKYNIRQLSGNQPGDMIHNTADIYFDQNPPIRTNTTMNTIHANPDMIMSVVPQNGMMEMEVFPNPFRDLVNIRLKSSCDDATRLEFWDVSGRMVFTAENPEGASYTIYRNQLEAGIYFYRLSAANGKVLSSGRVIAAE